MLIYLLGRGLLRLSLFTLATGYNSGMQKGGQNQMFVFKILAASKVNVQKCVLYNLQGCRLKHAEEQIESFAFMRVKYNIMYVDYIIC